MKLAASKLGYSSRNIQLDRIDTHSNQAGGACAMKLAGFYDEIIRNGKMVAVVEYFFGINNSSYWVFIKVYKKK